ncbi:hypothetical protein [Bacillus sp. FJAT-50079]|uniref:hypothetical protein n=1 Tax=Bacillus sp. FJAT-50079 TaxID=2833577 RepID=UPI001BC94D51|nr:hypothetical protein [Bacillus sp. FJAT-50079]MBS4210638.1 hypothetical protein [Bacillus sp. FJAT-50079]
MIGLLISNIEKEEIIYLLKREMDEIIHDLKDVNVDPVVKMAMKERYKTLFTLFKRVASHNECIGYMLHDKQ